MSSLAATSLFHWSRKRPAIFGLSTIKHIVELRAQPGRGPVRAAGENAACALAGGVAFDTNLLCTLGDERPRVRQVAMMYVKLGRCQRRRHGRPRRATIAEQHVATGCRRV